MVESRSPMRGSRALVLKNEIVKEVFREWHVSVNPVWEKLSDAGQTLSGRTVVGQSACHDSSFPADLGLPDSALSGRGIGGGRLTRGSRRVAYAPRCQPRALLSDPSGVADPASRPWLGQTGAPRSELLVTEAGIRRTVQELARYSFAPQPRISGDPHPKGVRYRSPGQAGSAGEAGGSRAALGRPGTGSQPQRG